MFGDFCVQEAFEGFVTGLECGAITDKEVGISLFLRAGLEALVRERGYDLDDEDFSAMLMVGSANFSPSAIEASGPEILSFIVYRGLAQVLLQFWGLPHGEPFGLSSVQFITQGNQALPKLYEKGREHLPEGIEASDLRDLVIKWSRTKSLEPVARWAQENLVQSV